MSQPTLERKNYLSHPCGCRLGRGDERAIVYCPLHAQAPAMRAALARLIATSDNPSAHALYMDEARAVLKAIKP